MFAYPMTRIWHLGGVSSGQYVGAFLAPDAVVAELADALDLGSSGLTPVEVRVLSAA